MTRKHFEAVAAVLRASCSVQDVQVREEAHGIARDLATVFAGLNPRFDRARFLAACGAEELAP